MTSAAKAAGLRDRPGEVGRPLDPVPALAAPPDPRAPRPTTNLRLGRRQQSTDRHPGESTVPPQQPVGVGVERAGQRLRGRRPEAATDPGAQQGRGPRGEREHQDLAWIEAAADAVGHEFDHGGRLAGARTREDEQGTTAVLDDPALGRIEDRRAGADRCGAR